MDTIKLDCKLPLSPAEVWIVLFSKSSRRVWWGDRVQLHPEEDSRFREYWRDSDGRDRLSKGRVLELKENALVRLSWKDDDWSEYTEVVFTLTAEDEGTRLELVHDDFLKLGPKLHYNVEEYLHGWEALFEDLTQYLAAGG
ncbi:SRPBCC domain-containing protein, partial [bacterium]|nr:SRPBCC domain-containing protein [bacterium]